MSNIICSYFEYDLLRDQITDQIYIRLIKLKFYKNIGSHELQSFRTKSQSKQNKSRLNDMILTKFQLFSYKITTSV